MTVDRTELTEIMAQAIGRAIGGADWWAVAKHEARDATRREAAAALTALEDAGYAVVPQSPDRSMCVAAGDLDPDQAAEVYRRMIEAFHSSTHGWPDRL